MLKVVIILLLAAFSQATTLKKIKVVGSKGKVSYADFSSRKAVPVQNIDADADIVSINQKFPSDFLTEGDMVKGSNQRSSITDESYFWQTTTIPIQYSSALGLMAIAGIEDARQEYEMRTCFTFPYRTTEKDYLLFEPLSGCWSYVGRIGGSQTVSIGSGCERLATVVHEIMHAIGIYHQQSRTDRDGYITIETQNIDSDKVYNFDKYSYDDVDNRRVSYDFDSVMHYGETAFSNNGEKTILTKDPQFQSRIGQRRTFSEGDATTINRMYSCADPLRLSYSCNFEESTLCGYVQEKVNDQADWLRYEVGETDGSSISSTLPQSDVTTGVQGQGSYIVVDSSSSSSSVATLYSMRLKSNNPEQCLQFSYYMDLEAGSNAQINVLLAEIDQTNGDIISTSPLLQISGDYEQYWNVERATIQAPSSYKLVFEALTSGLAGEVIAIDDVSILDKPCDTAYFTIQDYSSLLASTSKGDYLYGPLQYTEDGYAFKLLLYPHGTSSAADGYMSAYFALAQGDNDDSLQWPFSNQVLRFTVVDQAPDALSRMDNHNSFLTSTDAAWDRPTSSVGPAWGYTNFMLVDDVVNSRDYRKNDAVIFSTNVKNMNTFRQQHASAFSDPHPSEPVVKFSHSHHEDKPDRNINIEINVNPKPENKTQTEEDKTTITPAFVGAVAFGCAFAVLILMSIAIMCVNQSHKQAMTAISVANLSARTYEKENHQSNMAYQQEKI